MSDCNVEGPIGLLFKLWSRAKEVSQVILTPSCWLQNYGYSKELDEWFLESLKEGHQFIPIDKHTAYFNGREIWIANYPHACFRIYDGPFPDCRPSRTTIFKLRKRLMGDFLKNLK